MVIVSENENEVHLRQWSEFTWHMVESLPRAYYFKSKGNRIIMECNHHQNDFYYFVDEIKTSANGSPRAEMQHSCIYTYEQTCSWKDKWIAPPLKDHFKKMSHDVFAEHNIVLKKPLVVINNKYSIEWGRPPVIFFDLEFLDKVISELKHEYDIAYIRPFNNCETYHYDGQRILEWNDYEFIKEKHPDTILITDYNESFNRLQCCLESNSEKHISVAGGNASLSSYFGGEVIIYDNTTDRGIWKTGSWLSKLSGAKIHGYRSHSQILEHILKKWI